MPNFYFSGHSDKNGCHTVHVESCVYFLLNYYSFKIGSFYSFEDAITSAKIAFPRFNFSQCRWCSINYFF